MSGILPHSTQKTSSSAEQSESSSTEQAESQHDDGGMQAEASDHVMQLLDDLEEVKEVDLYSALIVVPYTQGNQVRITQL